MSLFDEIMKVIEKEAKAFQTEDGKEDLKALGFLLGIGFIGYLIMSFFESLF